jgi:hypothetical protein
LYYCRQHKLAMASYASAAVVCRSNRVEPTVNSHKEYHHGASHKVVSFEQPRPYAAAGR